MDRIIALIDMDCFYVQVEQRANPALYGQPCVVVQYRTYKGGAIIAVNYEARDSGVTRGMMGEEAKKKCPSVELVRVPESRGKANLTKYRQAGAEVIETLMGMGLKCCVERASIDEAYIDMTEEVKDRLQRGFKPSPTLMFNTVIAEYDAEINTEYPANDLAIQQNNSDNPTTSNSNPISNPNPHQPTNNNTSILTSWLHHHTDLYNTRLAIGACIVEELRTAVHHNTSFRCSAGISHNKMLSKLACGLNKPNKQTILSQDVLPRLFSKTSIHKIRNLGGKLGQSLKDDLGVSVMSDLCVFNKAELCIKYGAKNGNWIYNLCRGMDGEAVTARQLAQSIGCSKNFNGKEKLNTKDKVTCWVGNLADEVAERLNNDKLANNRVARTVTVSVTYQSFSSVQSSTRCCSLMSYHLDDLKTTSLRLLSQFNRSSNESPAWEPAILNMGISASNFSGLAGNKDAPSVRTIFHNVEKNLSSTPNNFLVNNKSFDHKKVNKENDGDNCERVVVNDKALLKSFESDTPVETRVERWLKHNEKYGHAVEDVSDAESVKECEVEIKKTPQSCSSGANILKAVVNSQLRASDILLNESSASRKRADFLRIEESRKGARSGNKLEEFLKRRVATSESACRGGEDLVKCDTCGRMISVWDVPEHDDFHFAKQLQREQYFNTPNKQASDQRRNEKSNSGIKSFFKASNENDLNDSASSNTPPSIRQMSSSKNNNLKRKCTNENSFSKKKGKSQMSKPAALTLDSFIQKKE